MAPPGPPDKPPIDRNALVRLQEFVACVDAIMNALPRPVPPAPPLGWDGQLLATHALYQAYNRLSAPLQAIAARGYQMCEYALTAQLDVAETARRARYWVFIDLLQQTGLRPEQLAPGEPEHSYLTVVPDDENEIDDEDEALRRAALATAAAHDPVPFAQPVTATPDGRTWRHAAWALSIGVLVAAGVVIALAWPRPAPAPSAVDTQAEKPAAPAAAPMSPSTFAIDRSARSGDLTVIMSHGEENDGGVSLHTYMVNDGDTEHEADITVHEGDKDTAVPPPERIPPKSTRHRVIKVPRTQPAGELSVTVGGAQIDNIGVIQRPE